MTITANDQYRHPPRISIDRFGQILRERANPAVVAERNPDEYYQAIVNYGIDPLFVLAMFNHESSMGKAGVAVTSKSWGNTRTPNFGASPIGDMPGRTGRFPIWASWLDGCKSTAARLATPDYYYAGENRNIGEVFSDPHYPKRDPNRPIHPPNPRPANSPREWAPAGDLNSPSSYLGAMLRFMNEHADFDQPDPKPEEPPMAGDIPGVPFVAADSRHYTKGRTVTWPDLLVQHHTDGWDSLNWLTISPSSNVSSTYLLRHDGTIRAQLVRHADTPHTTGALNPRTLTFEWERKWPEQREVSDEQYRNIGQSWAKVVLAERARGNPNFQSDPKRSQMGGHKDYGNTTCPGNLDIDRVYREMMDALLPGSDVQPDPNSKQFETGHYIVNTTIDGTPVKFLDFYEREGGIVQLGMPLEGMWRGPDNVFRQVLENAVLELWPDGFGNVEGPVYRFGRYLDHVDRIRERLEDAA